MTPTFTDYELEREIIGNLLSDPNSYADIFDLMNAGDFADERHADFFRAFSDLYHAKQPVDPHALAETSRIPLKELAEAMENGWFSASIKSKAKRLREFAGKRQVLNDCRQIVKSLESASTAEVAGQLSALAAKILLQQETKKIYNAHQIISTVLDAQEERLKEKSYIQGIKTGYGILDQTIRGLRPKRMTVIAAGTGFGKSTFALNLWVNAVKRGHKALFVSNENDALDNLDRVCGMIAKVDLKQVESGTAFDTVAQAVMREFEQRTAFISDNSPRTVDEIVGTINRYVIQHQVELVFVDYVGEISGDSVNRETEEAKLARYTQKLLDCAKAQGVHLVLMAQLNREGNKKGRPSKTELGGCFRIAQKAHSLIVFWQDDGGQDVITVDKNRQGPPNVDIAVKFDRGMQLIQEQGYWNSTEKEVIKPQWD